MKSFSSPAGAILTFISCAASVAWSQTLPATAPATQPSVVTTPSGFVRFEASGRSIVTLPPDQAWVTQAVADIKPLPPSTRPSDLVDQLIARRDALKKQMLADLPTLMADQVDTFLDKELLPLARESAAVGPKLVYFVATSDRIKQTLRDGWTDRRLHYNPVNDNVDVTRPIMLDLPGHTDESVLLIVYKPSEPEGDRHDDFIRTLATADAKTDDALSLRAVQLLVGRISGFLAEKALADLPRGDGQLWLADGLSSVLAMKYVAMIHGAPLTAFIRETINKPIDPRVNAAAIDLLHPLPTDQLLPELVRPYAAAQHQKNVAAVYLWLINGGDAKLGETLAQVKKLAPADGETLANLVGSVSGVDIKAALEPK